MALEEHDTLKTTLHKLLPNRVFLSQTELIFYKTGNQVPKKREEKRTIL